MTRFPRPNWRKVLFWTVFVYALLMAFVIRFRWTLDKQREILGGELERRQSPTPVPGPDSSAREMSAEEVERQIQEVARAWEERPAEERRRALSSRVDEVAAMDPERVERVVEHLTTLTGGRAVEIRRVDITEVDLDSAVPVNMREAAEGAVVIELQDAEGRLAEIRVPREDLSGEERQALEAYRLMNRVPALEGLRPLLAPLLRGSATPAP